MEFKNVEDVIGKYKGVINEINRIERAIEHIKGGGEYVLSIRRGSSMDYTIKFNNEIGDACYRALLEELKQEKIDIEKRMEGWK